ncbi:MAG: hypothetical protein FWG71_07345 [Synergistaceae bacterium]|nr:hypothetical protein [Synergistaceae bacterium]
MMTKSGTDAASVETTGDSSDKREYFDHDGFWKDLIERFYRSLFKRALPELHEKADATKEARFLDKEFRDILNTSDPEIHTSPHFADFVLEVPMKNGDETWILLHIEAQGPGGGNLAERMYHYKCLIYAHYRREPVALAIVTEGRRKEDRFYEHSHFGTESVYRYNNLVLADLDDGELQASDNPIDLALCAAKCALKAQEEIQKFTYLRTLTGLLAERGWSREDKRDLLLFLERIMDLRDKELGKQYTEFRNQLSKEGKIVYIPLGERELAREIEQRGIEEGIAQGMAQGISQGMAQGMAQGKEEMARNLLANGVSPDIIARSAGLPVEKVRALVN